jgi:hypothetical protein
MLGKELRSYFSLREGQLIPLKTYALLESMIISNPY